MCDDDDLVANYFEMGAIGFVSKNSSSTVLIETIKSVVENGICFSKENSKALLNKIHNNEAIKTAEKTNFTKRELEIIKIIYSGKTNKEIAAYLNVSLKTIDFNKARIYKKTGTYTSVGIVVFALAKGLLG